MKTLLIDADSMVYAAACMAESRVYLARDSKGVCHGPFQTKKEALHILETDPAALVFTHVAQGDYDTALIQLRTKLSRIKKDAEERFGRVEVLTFVSGSANFRDRLPCRFPYKGNRVNVEKPQHLHRLRRALVLSGAREVHFMEPDDEITIRMTENADAIAVSVDKDIKQVPDIHMIPDQGFTSVSPRSALLRLYAQIIGGDPTDGVPGCYGITADGASKLLYPYIDSNDTLKQTERKFWKVTVDTYKASIAKRGARWEGHQDPEQAAIETARFVYLLRERPKDAARPKLWEPPT